MSTGRAAVRRRRLAGPPATRTTSVVRPTLRSLHACCCSAMAIVTSTEPGHPIGGGFGNSFRRTPSVLIEWHRETKGRFATIAVPITPSPMVAPARLTQDASLATSTSVGGRSEPIHIDKSLPHPMKSGNVVKIGLAVVLFGVAGFGFSRFFSGNDGVSEKTFFYDLSEKKLFSASRELVPPIRGLNNSEEDAVRAVVISKTGKADE